MTTKAARREHLMAMAQFERRCVELSRHMESIVEPPVPGDHRFLSPFGPRKPVKRALPRGVSGAIAVPKRLKAA
jgi:hypothetical protein